MTHRGVQSTFLYTHGNMSFTLPHRTINQSTSSRIINISNESLGNQLQGVGCAMPITSKSLVCGMRCRSFFPPSKHQDGKQEHETSSSLTNRPTAYYSVTTFVLARIEDQAALMIRTNELNLNSNSIPLSHSRECKAETTMR